MLPFKGPETRAKSVPRVLYIGPAADEICNIVTHHIGRVDIAYEQDVQAAFAQLRRREFDVVMVDQRDENLATRLILPVLQVTGLSGETGGHQPAARCQSLSWQFQVLRGCFLPR